MNTDEERELELFTMRGTLRTANGRSFLYRCLENCRTFEDCYNPDTTIAAYNSGRRSHGLWLERELREADADLYWMMMRENSNG